MNKILTLFLLISTAQIAHSQSDEEKKIGKRIFLPSIEIGYLHNSSDIISGGIIVKTSLEYRFTNNNDFLSGQTMTHIMQNTP